MTFSVPPILSRRRAANNRPQEREPGSAGEAQAPAQPAWGGGTSLARLTGTSILTEARVQHQTAERRSYFERGGRRLFRRHHLSEGLGNEAGPSSSRVAEPPQPTTGRMPIESLDPQEIGEATSQAKSDNELPESNAECASQDEPNEGPATRELSSDVHLGDVGQGLSLIVVTDGAHDDHDEATGVGDAAFGEPALPESTDLREMSNRQDKPDVESRKPNLQEKPGVDKGKSNLQDKHDADDRKSTLEICRAAKPTSEVEGQAPVADDSVAAYCYSCSQTLGAVRPGGLLPERKIHLICGHFMGHACYFNHVEASQRPRCPVATAEAPCIALVHQCGHKHFPSGEPITSPFDNNAVEEIPLSCTWCRDVAKGNAIQEKIHILRWRRLQVGGLLQSQRPSVINWKYARAKLWYVSVAPVYGAYLERKARVQHNRWWKRSKRQLARLPSPDKGQANASLTDRSVLP